MAVKDTGKYTLFLMLLILFQGCTTMKETLQAPVLDEATPSALSLLPSMNRSVGCLSGNVSMTATINGESAKAKGKLRLKSDEGVQVSATAMGLMEAACFEFLPQDVRFIYKMEKIYASSPYSELPFFSNSGTGYKVLESLITNRVFAQGGLPLDKDFTGATIEDNGEYVTLTVPLQGTSYTYHIEKQSGNLVRCEGNYGNEGSFCCLYSDFVPYEGTIFPSRIELSFTGGGTTASLLLELRDIKGKEFDFIPRRIQPAYEKVSLQWVLSSVSENIEK